MLSMVVVLIIPLILEGSQSSSAEPSLLCSHKAVSLSRTLAIFLVSNTSYEAYSMITPEIKNKNMHKEILSRKIEMYQQNTKITL